MTTQELVERLRGTYRIPITDGLGPAGGEEPGNADFFVRTFPTSPLAKAAADRLSEMDAENKRLKSEVEFLHLRRGQLVIERDKAREALNETIIDLNVYSDIGIIRARTIERRAALEHDKGEKL